GCFARRRTPRTRGIYRTHAEPSAPVSQIRLRFGGLPRQASGANSMGEPDGGMFGQVPLDFQPSRLRIFHPVTPRTERKQTAHFLQFALEFSGEAPQKECEFDATAYEPREPAVGHVDRAARVVNPAVLPVIAEEPVIHFEERPRLEMRTPCVQTRRTVVRVYPLQPAVSLFLLQSAAAILKPALVEIITLAGGICAPDQHRRLLHNYCILLQSEHIVLVLSLLNRKLSPVDPQITFPQIPEEKTAVTPLRARASNLADDSIAPLLTGKE